MFSVAVHPRAVHVSSVHPPFFATHRVRCCSCSHTTTSLGEAYFGLIGHVKLHSTLIPYSFHFSSDSGALNRCIFFAFSSAPPPPHNVSHGNPHGDTCPMCCDPLVPLKLIESVKGKIWLWSDSHTILSEYIAIVRDGDTDERRMPPEAEPTKCHGHVVTSKGRARSARRNFFEHLQ